LKLFDVRRLKDFRRTATVTTLRDPIMSLQRRSPFGQPLVIALFCYNR